jgi:hypothetical protein
MRCDCKMHAFDLLFILFVKHIAKLTVTGRLFLVHNSVKQKIVNGKIKMCTTNIQPILFPVSFGLKDKNSRVTHKTL